MTMAGVRIAISKSPMPPTMTAVFATGPAPRGWPARSSAMPPGWGCASSRAGSFGPALGSAVGCESPKESVEFFRALPMRGVTGLSDDLRGAAPERGKLQRVEIRAVDKLLPRAMQDRKRNLQCGGNLDFIAGQGRIDARTHLRTRDPVGAYHVLDEKWRNVDKSRREERSDVVPGHLGRDFRHETGLHSRIGQEGLSIAGGNPIGGVPKIARPRALARSGAASSRI